MNHSAKRCLISQESHYTQFKFTVKDSYTKGAHMSESVHLPALGESVTEGTVTRWLKNVGDSVAVDEPLLEVSTDKVDTEIPSPVAGILEEILVQEDETVEVGAVLARIGDGASASSQPSAPAENPAEAAEPVAASTSPVVEEAPIPAPVSAPTPAPQPVAAESAPVADPQPVTPAPAPVSESSPPSGPSGGAYVTPIVRKLANQLGVNLDQISGSGVGGRIRKEDVFLAAEKLPGAPSDHEPITSAPTVVSPLRGTTQPMSRLRKVIAERAVASMQQTAQLTTVIEVDMTRVAEFRAEVKDEFLHKTGTKLTFLPFFALAATEALQAYPIINANVDGENIVYPDVENISIAVDTERGLLTPVVKSAAGLTLAQYAEQINDLAERTRANKLSPDELSGGTFTLTNTGSRGALFDTPLVFLPQVAILGTGAIVKRPVVVSSDQGDAFAVRSMVYLALSYDHRIVDGADAARFLTHVKNRLEECAFRANLGI